MSKELNKFLGCIGEDTITGFKGLIIARTDYMYGCSRFHIQPVALKKDGTVGEIETFDFQRIKEIEKPPVETNIVESSINLGSLVKDILTGLEGIAGGITTTAFGEPPRIMIEPKKLDENGAPAQPLSIIEPRIKVLKDNAPQPPPDKKEDDKKRPGGPRDKYREPTYDART